MKIATTIGDFKHYTPNWAEAVKQFEGTGFRYLDFDFYSVLYPGSPFLGDDWKKDVENAAEEAAKRGFTFVQAHSPDYNPLSDKTDHEAGMRALLRSIEACGMLGIPNLVVHSGISETYRYPDGQEGYFKANRAFYESLFPSMEKYQVNVLIENSARGNMGDNYFFMTGQEMSDFIDECHHPRLQACWDTGHANMDSRDQYREIRTLDSRLKAIHFQDNFGACDEHFAPFMGTLDVDAVMQGLLDSGFRGYLTFEAQNLLTLDGAWPHPRHKTSALAERKLPEPSLELRREAEKLLYQIGKYVLTRYGCYEE